MRILSRMLFMVFSSLMAGCSTMNSDFSCKATAGDSCLTIEQVDTMTRFADGADSQYRPLKTIHKSRATGKSIRPNLSENNNEQVIWVAPWQDKSGRIHQAGRLYAGHLQHQALG